MKALAVIAGLALAGVLGLGLVLWFALANDESVAHLTQTVKAEVLSVRGAAAQVRC